MEHDARVAGALARRVLAGVLLALSSGCAASDAQQAAGPRLLVFSRTEAYRHASITPGVEALRRLAGERGWMLDATEDAAVFSAAGLASYDAVVFLSTTGDVLDDEEQAALEQYIHDGGGYVGIHAASDTEYDWPWYGRLVGGYFAGHPGGPNVREAALHVVETHHPATEGLPARWVREDEWYDIRDLQAGLTVLLNIDEGSYKRPDEHPAPVPRPIAWARSFEGGRMFYTALGHTDESFSEPLFLAHLAGGISWVIGGGAG